MVFLFVTSNKVENIMKMLAVKENFYKPLCVDGYLTPLQRKKLREKRNCQYTDGVASEEFKSKKPQPLKCKKECSSFKSKERLKKKKTKEIIPRVQCTAAKIVLRTLNNDGSCNRFFKSSSPNRLEKASFTMPLVYNKNSFSKVGKFVSSRKRLSNRDNSVPSTDVMENSKHTEDVSSEQTPSTNASNILENCDANQGSDVSGKYLAFSEYSLPHI